MQFGYYGYIKSLVESMQRNEILPKKITEQNCKHNVLVSKPKRKFECGICCKDIKDINSLTLNEIYIIR